MKTLDENYLEQLKQQQPEIEEQYEQYIKDKFLSDDGKNFNRSKWEITPKENFFLDFIIDDTDEISNEFPQTIEFIKNIISTVMSKLNITIDLDTIIIYFSIENNEPTSIETKEITSIDVLRVLAWIVIILGGIIALFLFAIEENKIKVILFHIILTLLSSTITGIIMLVFAGIAENVKNISK